MLNTGMKKRRVLPLSPQSTGRAGSKHQWAGAPAPVMHTPPSVGVIFAPRRATPARVA